MYEIAEQVARWLADGRTAHVAQVVATAGFSSHDPSAALAWTDDGEAVGALFPGVDADLRAVGGQLDGRLAELDVSDADAVAAGLSCGGTATVFVQAAAACPADVWTRLVRHEPLCLVGVVTGGAPGRTEVFTRADVSHAARLPAGAEVPRLFARGASGYALLVEGDTSLAVVTLWPRTALLVVGSGLIADALQRAAALLGWTARVVADAPSAVEATATLTESDAVLVLSHDRDVDLPALAAAVGGRAGYVGALGSRATQAARRAGLGERGVPAEAIARIHGPAGLDIDAHTPGEIAVSVVAEVLAERAGASGGSDQRPPWARAPNRGARASAALLTMPRH